MNIHTIISDDTRVPDIYGTLAQLVAQSVVSRKVTGSSPVRPAKNAAM